MDYAVALTRRPSEVTVDAVNELRVSGLDDEAILHVAEVVSYFNFVNRLAQGLGVELETGWAPAEPGKKIRKRRRGR